jgi:hypothetical protein
VSQEIGALEYRSSPPVSGVTFGEREQDLPPVKDNHRVTASTAWMCPQRLKLPVDELLQTTSSRIREFRKPHAGKKDNAHDLSLISLTVARHLDGDLLMQNTSGK